MHPAIIQKSTLALAIAAISSSVIAQEASTYQQSQPTLLNQVTVTATRTERQLDEVASSVSVVSAEDAEKQMARNIRDLVKYEPGVEVTNDSRFGLGSFNIRGMDQNRVKITVDGIDQAKAFGYEKFIQSQRNFFDIENMKSIEIVKGPASTLHGSNAIGGVVAFQTKDPADYLNPEGDDTYSSIKGGYNSADSSFNESFTVSNRSGALESMLIYTRRDGNEQETHGGLGGTGATREQADPADRSSNSLLGKIQYQVNDDHRIGFTGEWLEATSKGKELSVANTGGTTNYLASSSDDLSERQRLGFFHEWDANNAAFDTVNWSLDWQVSKSQQKTYDTVLKKEGKPLNKVDVEYNRFRDYVYEETNIQLDATFNKSLQTNDVSHLITYGFSYEDKKQDNLNKTTNLAARHAPGHTPDEPLGEEDVARYAPIASTSQLGIFLQDEIGFMNDRLMVTPGIRYDKFEVSNKADEHTIDYADKTALEDKSYESWTARLGAVYEINSTWSAFAQYSQGFSTPDLFDMYFEEHKPSGMPVWVKPNPNLEPEESDSYEVGLRANSRLGSMEITAFYNDYKNFIETQPLEFDPDYLFGVYQAVNMSDATIKGIELKGQLWLDEAFNAPEGTRLNAAISWAEGRGTIVKEKDKAYTVHENEPLNSVAPLTAVIGLGYDAPSELWGSELVWTLVAAKDSDDISDIDSGTDPDQPGGDQFATPGFGVVDLTAYYKPTKDITINAGIFNATDKKYWMWDDVRTLTSDYSGLGRYTQPGRNYSISVKWEI